MSVRGKSRKGVDVPFGEAEVSDKGGVERNGTVCEYITCDDDDDLYYDRVDRRRQTSVNYI